MSRFIEFFGSAHLNNRNLAAYETNTGVKLIAEQLVTGENLGEKEFDSYEESSEWFSELPGINNASRLDTALFILSNREQ